MTLSDDQLAMLDRLINQRVRVTSGDLAGAEGVVTDWKLRFGGGDPVFEVQIAGGIHTLLPGQIEPTG